MKKTASLIAPLAVAAIAPLALLGGATTRTNPPSECQAARNTCGCPKKADEGTKDDGTGTYSSCRAAGPCTADGPDVENGCIKIWLDLGRTTPWTGSMACSLKLFADDEASDIFYSESLYPSIGGYTFKRLGQKTMPDGRTPAEVVLNHPRGEPVHFTFRDGGSWGTSLSRHVVWRAAVLWRQAPAPVSHVHHSLHQQIWTLQCPVPVPWPAPSVLS